MFAPINRSTTLTLSLCASLFSSVEAHAEEGVLELGSTEILAQGLGSTTENPVPRGCNRCRTAPGLRQAVAACACAGYRQCSP